MAACTAATLFARIQVRLLVKLVHSIYAITYQCAYTRTNNQANGGEFYPFYCSSNMSVIGGKAHNAAVERIRSYFTEPLHLLNCDNTSSGNGNGNSNNC